METKFTLDSMLGQQLDDAIRRASKVVSPSQRDAMLRILRSARRQWERRGAYPHAGTSQMGDDFALSLILSALSQEDASALAPRAAEDLFAPAATQASGVERERLWGAGQYADNDPRWVKAFLGYLKSDPQPFPLRKEGEANVPGTGIVTMNDVVRIAIAGDWGTGNRSSLDIAAQIKAQSPHYTIHLGDVYYSGQADEEMAKFVDPWPDGSIGSFALNSNHEMYSGGIGYFRVALPHPKFALQGGLSYFLLQNDQWAIFGLDSAYYSSSFLYDRGQLDPVQVNFLHRFGRRALEEGKRVVVLTHHTGLTLTGQPVEPLWSQVTNALGTEGTLFWYWGHEHAAASFKKVYQDYDSGKLVVNARCVGHGGVPFGPIAANPALDWSEDKQFSGDPGFPHRARNGFVLLTINREQLTEEFWDETGERRF